MHELAENHQAPATCPAPAAPVPVAATVVAQPAPTKVAATVVAQPKRPSTPGLPEGWERKTAPDGRTYYVDHARDRAQRLRASDRRARVGSRRRRARVGGNGARPSTGSRGDAAAPSRRRRGRDADPSAARVVDHPDRAPQVNKRTSWEPPAAEAPLPAGWEKKTAPDGRTYYVDRRAVTKPALVPSRCSFFVRNVGRACR